MKTKILIVEDEEGLRLTLSDRLENEGYVVSCAIDGNEALTAAERERPDLMILDVMLPGKNGFDVCRDLRQRGNHIPILMLTARREVVDRVVGLKLGADDYLTKPFDMMELLARVEALLRRVSTPQPSLDAFTFGDISVDFIKTEVRRNGKQIPCTALDFKLLRYFIDHRGETLSRNQLLDEVWEYDAPIASRTVDVHVAGLRQKIEPVPEHPRYIVTVHRMGYKFLDSPA